MREGWMKPRKSYQKCTPRPEDYLDLNIERDRSEYPRGLRHYTKEKLIENSLFDLHLLWHKVTGIVKGHEDETGTTRHKEESRRSAKEILRGIVQRILYEDWDTSDSEREIDTITGRYLSHDEEAGEGAEEVREGCFEGIQEGTQEL